MRRQTHDFIESFCSYCDYDTGDFTALSDALNVCATAHPFNWRSIRAFRHLEAARICFKCCCTHGRIGILAITDVELTRASISSISSEQLHTVLENADMPIPMDRCVMKNIASEAFSKTGVTTLGDYFNQTIVCVVINILALLLLFTILRLLFGFVIRGVEYGRGGFPVLSRADGLIGAGVGLIHGVLMLFVIL
jgi:hypothetical protein